MKRLREGTAAIGAKFIVFNGKDLSLKQQASLFANATVVVGVHGAAFANILFSSPKVMVAELSFNSEFTKHYAHAATALGFEYKAYPLEGDERGAGADTVKYAVGVAEALLDDVISHIGQSCAAF